MVKNNIRLQKRLREGDSEALEEVYLNYKSSFLLFFQSRTNGDIDIEDLYQDSVIAMYQNFVLKKIQLQSGSLQTYLFAIGKNKVATIYNEQFVPLKKEEKFIDAFFDVDGNDLSREQELLRNGYSKLGEKCSEMLRLYYYRGLSDKEIVNRTRYKDENTIKSYRSRCLKKLKELIHGKEK